jgi:hypothetical protein
MTNILTNHWISNPQYALLHDIHPAMKINKYGVWKPPTIPRKFVLSEPKTTPIRSLQDLRPKNQFELSLTEQCTLSAENPQQMCLSSPKMHQLELNWNRMTRVEYFTNLAKIGSRTKESFTPLLISKVYLVKTLKTLKYLELSSQEARHQNINQHNERIEASISLLYPFFTFSLKVTFNSLLMFLHKITLLI